jgi:hypothetical protein
MKLPVTTRERAEAIAHEQAMAYLGTVMHIIRVSWPEGDHHFVLHDNWVPGEMLLVGQRVASIVARPSERSEH